jgi:putative oxidoreductase
MVLAVVAITIAMLGPGQISVDDALGIADDLDGYVGLAISAGGGIAAAALLLAVFFRPPSD